MKVVYSPFRQAGAILHGSNCQNCSRRRRNNEEFVMSMWLYDDAREMEDFQNYQKEVRRLEREYLEIRFLLRDAETDYRADPVTEARPGRVLRRGQ